MTFVDFFELEETIYNDKCNMNSIMTSNQINILNSNNFTSKQYRICINRQFYYKWNSWWFTSLKIEMTLQMIVFYKSHVWDHILQMKITKRIKRNYLN